jgi:hypothetical protein
MDLEPKNQLRGISILQLIQAPYVKTEGLKFYFSLSSYFKGTVSRNWDKLQGE